MRSKTAACAILGGIALITTAILYLPRSVDAPPPLPIRLPVLEPLHPAPAADVPRLPIVLHARDAHRALGSPAARPPLVSATSSEAMPAVNPLRAEHQQEPIVSARPLASHAVLAPAAPVPGGLTGAADERKPGPMRRAGRSVAAAFSVAGRSIGGAFRWAF